MPGAQDEEKSEIWTGHYDSRVTGMSHAPASSTGDTFGDTRDQR